MTDRPILFSAPMVRAILAGTKTQTRRVVKPQPTEINPRAPGLGILAAAYRDGDFAWPSRGCPQAATISCKPNGPDGWALENSPYGAAGDRLWVREAWARTIVGTGTEMVVYREGDNRTDYGGPWKPGIHMFRRDSRITLEVTGVRVERLQAISRGDAMAEGCPFPNMAAGDDPRQWYRDLWDQINGAGAWDANPWVWVIEFRRMEA